jgi:hypothetical protein
LQLKLELIRRLFIGVLVPCRTGLGDELNLVSKTFLHNLVEANQEGEKSVGAVDSRGRMTRRRFDRGPNTEDGPVLGQRG